MKRLSFIFLSLLFANQFLGARSVAPEQINISSDFVNKFILDDAQKDLEKADMLDRALSVNAPKIKAKRGKSSYSARELSQDGLERAYDSLFDSEINAGIGSSSPVLSDDVNNCIVIREHRGTD